MTDHFGLETVQAYMGHVQDNAEESVRRVIEALADSTYEYPTDQAQPSLSKSVLIRKSAKQQ